MLALLSPAKSLDYDTPLPTRKHSVSRMLDDSEALIETLRGQSVSQIASLMHLSDELAALNAQRYADFEVPFSRRSARPAVLAMAGDTYRGLAVRETWNERDYTEAQKSVRILSGLYGVLRPLDLMLPYRLEMGTRLRTDRGATLYAFWGQRITDMIRGDLAASPGAAVVVNLASDEYAKSVNFGALDARVVTPRFEDTDPSGRRQVISFYAKHARGAMASWLVRHRIRTAAPISSFAEDGYRLDAAASTKDHPVFVRTFEARTA